MTWALAATSVTLLAAVARPDEDAVNALVFTALALTLLGCFLLILIR